MRYYDHTATPPAPVRLPCVLRGVSLPEHCPPEYLAELGLYHDGGRAPVPDGMLATGWTREVRNGLSVDVPSGLISIAEQKIARQASKSESLKTAENALIAAGQAAGAASNKRADQVAAVRTSAAGGVPSLNLAVKWLNEAINVVAEGGSLDDLPPAPHQ